MLLTPTTSALKPDVDWIDRRRPEVQQFDHEGSTLTAPRASGTKWPPRQARYEKAHASPTDGWTVTSQTGQYFAEAELLQLGGEVLAVSETRHASQRFIALGQARRPLLVFGPHDLANSPDLSLSLPGRRHGHARSTQDVRSRSPTGWLSGRRARRRRSAPSEATALVHSGSDPRSPRARSTGQRRPTKRWPMWHSGGATPHRQPGPGVRQCRHASGLAEANRRRRHLAHFRAGAAPCPEAILTVVDSVWMDSKDLQGEGDSLVWDGRPRSVSTSSLGSPRHCGPTWTCFQAIRLTLFLDENQPELLGCGDMPWSCPPPTTPWLIAFQDAPWTPILSRANPIGGCARQRPAELLHGPEPSQVNLGKSA